MKGFVFGVAGFVLAVASYAIVVRRWPRLASTRVLSFFLILGSGATILILAAIIDMGDAINEVTMALGLSWSLAMAFVAANTAIETDSPTQSLVLFLHDHRATGVTEDMINRFADERPFRDSRLEGLIKDGLVRCLQGRLICMPSGRLSLDMVNRYRKLIARTSVTG